MNKQKFNKGDHVQVAKDLGSSMSHFPSGCEAIVIGSYADQHGGNDTKSYTIHIKGSGQTSWYYENQLELIEVDRIDLLDQWEQERQAEIDLKSDLDWIFSHGQAVLTSPHEASVQALADCFGLIDLWGSLGEGIDLYNNSRQTIALAEPFLRNGDKQGWLDACEDITITKITTKAINEPLLIEANSQ